MSDDAYETYSHAFYKNEFLRNFWKIELEDGRVMTGIPIAGSIDRVFDGFTLWTREGEDLIAYAQVRSACPLGTASAASDALTDEEMGKLLGRICAAIRAPEGTSWAQATARVETALAGQKREAWTHRVSTLVRDLVSAAVEAGIPTPTAALADKIRAGDFEGALFVRRFLGLIEDFASLEGNLEQHVVRAAEIRRTDILLFRDFRRGRIEEVRRKAGGDAFEILLVGGEIVRFARDQVVEVLRRTDAQDEPSEDDIL